MEQQDTMNLVERIRKMKECHLTIYEIVRKTGLTESEVYAILRSFKQTPEPYKFPIQLLEDWDRTRLAILRKYGGAKYRDEKR